MATSKFQVEKFTGENDFHLWRLKMRALLVHQGLEETLGDPRSEKKPSKLSNEEMQDALDKAHSTLILSLSDGVLREVGDQTTAVGLWKKLEDLYTKKSLTKRLCTKKRIYTLQMEEGSSLANHIDNFNRIILDLEDINCHKEGHFKKDCPERKNKEKDGPKRNGDVAVASDEKDDDGYDSAGVLLATGTQTNGKWVLDSGCTYHMCPDKNLFTSYRLFNGGEVMMGNNSLCKVVGLGTIRLKMFDGVIRELSEVRHVLELKKNLISLGILDQMGCTFKMESGVMRIIKGSMVIMKGAKNNALYVLQGTTITRDVSVSTSQNLNKTLMWQIRLGHMSEKGMKILERQGVLGDNKLDPIEFCENGVVRHKTVRHTPQQNGLAERMNRTLMDKVRYLLIHSKLPQSLWAETLMTACYLVNRSPSSAIDFKTPVEMWSSRAANYSDLKIFGCPAFAHVKQGKLEPRALKCVFLGYPEGVKGYRLWCTDLKPPRCIVSRDVVFNEQEMLKSYTKKLEDSNKDTGSLEDQIKVELTGKAEDTTSYEMSEDEERDAGDSDEASETTQELDYDEPKSYKEAVSGKNADQWLKAMKEEMDSLYKNDTWTLVRKPDKKKVIGCKWVYKLKQGISRVEPVRFKARLVAKGFTQKKGVDFTERCNLDCCVYFKEDSWMMVYLDLYVNDMLIASVCMSLIEELKKKLKGEFDMKDLGPAKKILGILSDQLCLKAETEISEMMNVPYASAVGCLMYAIVLTRPDLSYVVSVVSRYMANPGEEHWRAVKWILRYLNGTGTYGLMYGGQRQDDSQIVGYVDSDYAGDLDRRRSLTGYLFTFNNCTVNWKAQLQSVVACSTEAKYTATTEVVKEAIWLKGILKELGVDQRSIMINCDSQSAICLSKNQTHYERTKHIDIKLHFIRLEVLKATVKLQKIHTDKNVADILTKLVTTAKFKLCLELAGICQK
ncbi:hypothetical protein KPL70_023077 [Citrus sinensis]|nr:hypothetical protein KPL70_023077 [Citrus sinensis]